MGRAPPSQVSRPACDVRPANHFRQTPPGLIGPRCRQRAGDPRGSASPAAAVALLRMNTQADIRSVLPTIRVPALVMNRIEDGDVKSDEARFIASRIPGAGLMLFPGADHVPWVGQTEEILDEIEEFLTGARHSHPGDRVLATILSTDIVESTQLVARLGDRTWRDLLDRHHTMIRGELMRY